MLEQDERIDIVKFSYKIDQTHCKLSNGADRHVYIKFVNGHFHDARTDVVGEFKETRAYWNLIWAISEKIEELERLLNLDNDYLPR